MNPPPPATLTDPATATLHPLEPLTGEEFAQTAEIVRRETGLGVAARFVFISLKEPPKDVIRAWEPGVAGGGGFMVMGPRGKAVDGSSVGVMGSRPRIRRSRHRACGSRAGAPRCRVRRPPGRRSGRTWPALRPSGRPRRRARARTPRGRPTGRT
ncbi:hypothetical protein EON77_10960 [bacterium]|nr:MAG: hypothetical protein EON77_10960 [bacterium]